MRDVSDLEREYELELESPDGGDDMEREFEALDDDREDDDREDDDREDDDREADDDREDDDREDDDREADDDREDDDREYEDDPRSYAERFHALSRREFESEAEAEDSIRDILGEMERNYFFGSLLKRAKKAVGGLAKKGLRFALDRVKQLPVFQAVKGMTQLLRGNLGDTLMRIAKAGLLSAIPGAGVALPALQALGFGGGGGGGDKEAWRQFSELAREAYEQAAERVDEDVDDPLTASSVAHEALKRAMGRVYRRPHGGVRTRSHRRRRRVVYVLPGESLIVRTR
jgi:hypothetical protein